MPFRKITQKEFKQQYKPWISSEILRKIRYKHILYKKMCKEKDENKKKSLLEECKRIRNELTNATRTSKKAYYDAYFSRNTNNLRNIWKGIKEIINIKSKNLSSPLCVQNDKGKLVDSPQDIAYSFNKYYSSIAGIFYPNVNIQDLRSLSITSEHQLQIHFLCTIVTLRRLKQ